MTATAAHSMEAVVAAGFGLRAKGTEPTKPLLFAALGRTGHPTTIWKYWNEHLATELPSLPAASGAASPAMSGEATKALQVVMAGVLALVDLTRREATAPYNAAIEALTAALVDAKRETANQAEVIDAQHGLIEELQAKLAKAATPKPSLLLRA